MVLNHVIPWEIFFVEEFVHVLHEKSFVMQG